MKRLAFALLATWMAFVPGHAVPLQTPAPNNKNVGAPSKGFPRTVRVRLWYLHPPSSLILRAEEHQAQLRKCQSCTPADLSSLNLASAGARITLYKGGGKATKLLVSGVFQMLPATGPPLRADFPIEIRASQGRLLITATLPMNEYVAGVLAGETGNFKSDEALKAMAVAARTYAMHFGSRHAQEDFDLCDTTHCQDLRVAGINSHLRQIAEATSGEVLWYEGQPAATYYHANCAGMTEDARFLLGNDEPKPPYLKQHADVYCVRHGSVQWQTEVTKRELQRALATEGLAVPGVLRSVSVVQRTPSGRVEVLRLIASSPITISGTAFRSAVGRNIGWERLKSNWYDVTVAGDRIVFQGRGSGHGVGLCQIGAEVMGEEGKSYREILAYYYPGTTLGTSAQGIAWQKLTGESIELLTTHPEADQLLLPTAEHLLRDAETTTGLAFSQTPQWKIYPSVAMFRDATGEPGWVAAATRGRTIQSQPADVLKRAGTLESTLRHEFLHMLIEAHAKASLPVWYREGLVLYLSEPQATTSVPVSLPDKRDLEKAITHPASEEQLRNAYSEAHGRVAALAQKYGKGKLITWVQQGLPPEVQ